MSEHKQALVFDLDLTVIHSVELSLGSLEKHKKDGIKIINYDDVFGFDSVLSPSLVSPSSSCMSPRLENNNYQDLVMMYDAEYDIDHKGIIFVKSNLMYYVHFRPHLRQLFSRLVALKQLSRDRVFIVAATMAQKWYANIVLKFFEVFFIQNKDAPVETSNHLNSQLFDGLYCNESWKHFYNNVKIKNVDFVLDDLFRQEEQLMDTSLHKTFNTTTSLKNINEFPQEVTKNENDVNLTLSLADIEEDAKKMVIDSIHIFDDQINIWYFNQSKQETYGTVVYPYAVPGWDFNQTDDDHLKAVMQYLDQKLFPLYCKQNSNRTLLLEHTSLEKEVQKEEMQQNHHNCDDEEDEEEEDEEEDDEEKVREMEMCERMHGYPRSDEISDSSQSGTNFDDEFTMKKRSVVEEYHLDNSTVGSKTDVSTSSCEFQQTQPICILGNQPVDTAKIKLDNLKIDLQGVDFGIHTPQSCATNDRFQLGLHTSSPHCFTPKPIALPHSLPLRPSFSSARSCSNLRSFFNPQHPPSSTKYQMLTLQRQHQQLSPVENGLMTPQTPCSTRSLHQGNCFQFPSMKSPTTKLSVPQRPNSFYLPRNESKKQSHTPLHMFPQTSPTGHKENYNSSQMLKSGFDDCESLSSMQNMTNDIETMSRNLEVMGRENADNLENIHRMLENIEAMNQRTNPTATPTNSMKDDVMPLMPPRLSHSYSFPVQTNNLRQQEKSVQTVDNQSFLHNTPFNIQWQN